MTARPPTRAAAQIVSLVLLAQLHSSAAFLDQFSGGQGACLWTCSDNLVPVQKPEHKPQSNGCGLEGMDLSKMIPYEFEPACDLHDICYDTCSFSKAHCDKMFLKRMRKICQRMYKDQLQECKKAADSYYSMASMFGCATYKASQDAACTCMARDTPEGQAYEERYAKMLEAKRRQLKGIRTTVGGGKRIRYSGPKGGSGAAAGTPKQPSKPEISIDVADDNLEPAAAASTHPEGAKAPVGRQQQEHAAHDEL